SDFTFAGSPGAPDYQQVVQVTKLRQILGLPAGPVLVVLILLLAAAPLGYTLLRRPCRRDGVLPVRQHRRSRGDAASVGHWAGRRRRPLVRSRAVGRAGPLMSSTPSRGAVEGPAMRPAPHSPKSPRQEGEVPGTAERCPPRGSGGQGGHLVNYRRLGALLEQHAHPGGPGDVRRHPMESRTGLQRTHRDPFAVGLDLDLTGTGTHDAHHTHILWFGEVEIGRASCRERV